MPALPTSPVLAAALLGGFAIGRRSGDRKLAGLALAAGLGYAAPRWARHSPALSAALTAGTVGLVGASHPLSRRLGPWGAVLTSATAAAALGAVGDSLVRRATRPRP